MLQGTRLVALVLGTCPLSRAAGLRQGARAELGEASSAAADDRLLPAGPDQDEQVGRADGAVKPPASWLRVWAWPPVLPAPLRSAAGRAAGGAGRTARSERGDWLFPAHAGWSLLGGREAL